jgi:hypothetical protein
MRNLSILGVVILALSLFVLNAVADRPAIVGEEGPELAGMLGDDGGESDTDLSPKKRTPNLSRSFKSLRSLVIKA